MANDPITQVPEQFTPAQLSDGTILHFKGQLNPDQVRDKVAEFRSKQSNGVDIGDLQNRTMGQSRQQLLKPLSQAFASPADAFDQMRAAPTPADIVSKGLGESIQKSDRTALQSGQPSAVASPVMRMAKSTVDAARGVAAHPILSAGIAAANTNPITAIPVDAALAIHGGAGVYQHRQALKDLATTGSANPDELEAGLNSASEMTGGMAGAGAGARAALKPSIPAQNTAIQKSLDPGWGKRQAFQSDVEGARPYLGGKGVKNVSDLQQTIPGVKNEIWKPYEDALGRFGHEPVEGPNGPTTFGDLEARRVELSNQLHSLNSKDPVAAQTIISQGKTPAQLLDEQNTIEGLIDERMKRDGVNSPLVRRTIGNVKGVERQVSGTNTLSEEPQRYGFGRMAQDFDANPFHPFRSLGNTVKGVVAGTKDLAAGRPAWSGKPTDVGIAEGLQSGAEKPSFQTTTSPEPLGPLPAPPGPAYATPAGPAAAQAFTPRAPAAQVGGLPPLGFPAQPNLWAPPPNKAPQPQWNTPTRITTEPGAVAPPAPPAIPSNRTGATLSPSGPSPAASGTPTPASSSPPPPLPPVPASPINPQEVADYSQMLGRPVTAQDVPAIRARLDMERNINTGLSGNRSDTMGNIREAHRATLPRPKDQKR